MSNPALSYGFEKKLRLLKAADFQCVFKQTQYKVSCQHFLVLAIENSLTFPRLGLVIGKKNVPTAVQRNQVKRLFREIFRQNQHLLSGLDIVILARNGLGTLSNAQTSRLTENLLRDLLQKATKARANLGNQTHAG